ncbi:hypothetical protein ACFPPE_06855 [Agromyces tardus]|uniref:hypothetical protein n=1 Tax=Agromyces tardus TaxID=2583849 RepID=UPI00361D01A5
MKVFEIILSEQAIENTVVEEYQVIPWQLIFDTSDLAGMFDLAPAPVAIEAIDAALARLTANSEEIREAIDPRERLGLRGYRTRLLAMRRDLANNPDARMSGLIAV